MAFQKPAENPPFQFEHAHPLPLILSAVQQQDRKKTTVQFDEGFFMMAYLKRLNLVPFVHHEV